MLRMGPRASLAQWTHWKSPNSTRTGGVSGGHLQGTGNAGPLAENDEQGGGHQGSEDQDGEAGPYQVSFHSGLPVGEER